MRTLTQDITVPNTTASLEPVRRMVNEFLRESPFDDRNRRLLVLAIDETVTSNIRYSEAMGRNGTTRVSLDLNEDRLLVRVEDTGQDRDPETTERFEEHLNRTRPYEIGIFLVQQIMDEIHYVFRKGFRNELELVRFVFPKGRARS